MRQAESVGYSDRSYAGPSSLLPHTLWVVAVDSGSSITPTAGWHLSCSKHLTSLFESETFPFTNSCFCSCLSVARLVSAERGTTTSQACHKQAKKRFALQLLELTSLVRQGLELIPVRMTDWNVGTMCLRHFACDIDRPAAKRQACRGRRVTLFPHETSRDAPNAGQHAVLNCSVGPRSRQGRSPNDRSGINGVCYSLSLLV